MDGKFTYESIMQPVDYENTFEEKCVAVIQRNADGTIRRITAQPNIIIEHDNTPVEDALGEVEKALAKAAAVAASAAASAALSEQSRHMAELAMKQQNINTDHSGGPVDPETGLRDYYDPVQSLAVHTDFSKEIYEGTDIKFDERGGHLYVFDGDKKIGIHASNEWVYARHESK